jgi:glycerol-3-phosphate acyltransferase PlsX
MRIAVDVMGGDHGCGVVIAGVKRALEEQKEISAIYLVGNRADIHAALPEGGFRDHRVKVVHTTEVVEMEDKPAIALRKKKDSSIARAAELVSEGKADALVSIGNTGGIFAAGTFKIGRIPGVDRGCIATVIPRLDNEFVLLDAGANVECKPIHLAQFAVMGNAFSREVLKRKNPRVGILSNGTEDTKGNDLTLEAFRLCKKLDFNFIGNIEGHDLFKDHVDVVVCDGFVGNIVLKTAESLAVAVFQMLKHELMHTTQRKLGAYLAKGAFHAIRRRMDPDVHGGAPMLGFNGLVFKAHASARDKAVTSAIRATVNALKNQINETIARDIAAANKILAAETILPATE